MRRAAAVGLLTLLCACSSFQGGRPLDQLPLPVPADQKVEVWSRGKGYQLHTLTVDADSVRGVRWWHDPTCDGCRVTLARTAVDSVRTLDYNGGETGVVLLLSLPLALFLWLVTRGPD